MFRNTVLVMAAVALIAAAPVFSASLEELVGFERAAALRAADSPITQVQSRNPGLSLIPRHEELKEFVNSVITDLAPGLMVETLSLAEPAGNGQLDLFNHLTALSTLSGIQYYSERRKAMHTLYETSRVIDNPTDKNPLPDPAFTQLPDSLELYARQKDLTFGDNIYSFNYRTGSDCILLVQENLSPMSAGIIPAVGKNKFRSVIAVIDTGDSLLIYAAAMAKTVSLPGLGDRIGRSFTNRITAILNWLNEQLMFG